MKVELKRANDNFHFKAVGSAGVEVNIDAAESIGGQNAGARPMELMLMSLGACSSIDIIQILKKQNRKSQNLILLLMENVSRIKFPLFSKK